ncbi:MAG: methionine gamma-lyase family protein [Clostridia bacterium]|nr:methionine gamma-lyase family protein [Clostridia bacterium]
MENLVLEPEILKLGKEAEQEIQTITSQIEEVSFYNHQKVLQAFQAAQVSDYHLKPGSGYGYDDLGRDKLEEVYCRIFKTEAALVRGQIVSGTHALALCLFGLLRPGDELLSVQGGLYDTLATMIGLRENGMGTLKDWGVSYREIKPGADGYPDPELIRQAIKPQTKMVTLQRSRGYSLRPSLELAKMQEIIQVIRSCKEDIVIMVDNCYGEFVEKLEPTEIGADLMAGSLMKNPGGGLIPSGGYVVGKEKYVQMAAARWTAPGIGGEVGPAPEFIRLMYQGLFMAPQIVAGALQGAVFTARLLEKMGFKAYPAYDQKRTDIIQSLVLDKAENLIAFCQGIQAASPIDSHVRPIPDPMPGYADPIIMAAGTFIQGATLEMSADAPLREPFAVYLQGGLSPHYAKLAVLNAASFLYRYLANKG